MNKFSTWLFGAAVGAALMFMALKYSVIRANDGHHLIRKSNAQLSTAYIDIREYTALDWQEHIELATDIANSENAKLQEEVTQSAMNNSIESMWDNFQNSQ